MEDARRVVEEPGDAVKPMTSSRSGTDKADQVEVFSTG
jgi:hypothetical protein